MLRLPIGLQQGGTVPPAAFTERTPQLFSSIPRDLRWGGGMSEWARMTRPGQAIHSFLEGPAFDEDGRLWLSDVAFGRIFSIDREGAWQLELEYGGVPHAAKPWAWGRLLIADYLQGLLAWKRGDDAPTTLVAEHTGEPFRGLSDLTIDRSGTVWFTDSGRSSLADPSGRLFAITFDEGSVGQLRVALGDIPYPNGVVCDGEDGSVFVAVTRANAIWRLTGTSVWLAGGGMRPMAGVHAQLSGGLGPDGLALDPATGNLAVAQAQAGRAYVFDRFGDPLAVVRTPGRWTTSVAFDRHGSLFVIEAERGEIWRAELPEAPLIGGTQPSQK